MLDNRLSVDPSNVGKDIHFTFNGTTVIKIVNKVFLRAFLIDYLIESIVDQILGSLYKSVKHRKSVNKNIKVIVEVWS